MTGSSTPAIKNIGKELFCGFQSSLMKADFNSWKRFIKPLVVKVKPHRGSLLYEDTVSKLEQIHSFSVL